MLERILNLANIDDENPEVNVDLKIDLKKMDHFEYNVLHLKNVIAYTVTVKLSRQTYRSGIYRFTFEIQYGNKN
jgi:hypothetical protein